MARRALDPPSSTPGWWTATGWAAAVVTGAALMAVLALPDTSPAPLTTVVRDDVWRPAWLVLGLLMAYPVFRAAQASWPAGPALVLLLVGQTWYIVSTGLDSLGTAGLLTGYDNLWYMLVLLQVVLAGLAASTGGAQCWRRRRWTRRMLAQFPDLARAELGEVLPPPAWGEGFYIPADRRGR